MDRKTADLNLVEVCGNVAAGKSTLTMHLHDNLAIPAILEEPSNLSLFSRYTEAPKDWAYPAQLQFIAAKFARLQLLRTVPFGIIDRSFEEDGDIFAKLNHEFGYMSDDEYFSYQTIYAPIRKAVGTPRLSILVVCSLEETERRIMRRQENERRMLRGTYFERLVELYAKFERERTFDLVFNSETDSFYDVVEQVRHRLMP